MLYHQSEKKWLWRREAEDLPAGKIRALARELDIPEIIVRLLWLRNISDREVISEFLAPALAQLPRPHLMKGMEKAVATILAAVHSREPITIYGDFDADGVTATSLLYLFFREIGANIQFYIPDRLSEGYGLNLTAVKNIFEANIQRWGRAGLLLTADCGISDTTEVEAARKLGFRVVVTDHHRPPPILPGADAILNPLQPGCSFPCKNLAGVGVAFYLALGVRSALKSSGHYPDHKIPNLKSYMDLVAIGTLADQVPVTGCNRIIIRAGLEILNTTCRIGLQELLAVTRNHGGTITPEVIAFQVAPRINAVGRLGSAETAVHLMITGSRAEAQKIAQKLEAANADRKNIEAEIFSEALQMIDPAALAAAHSLILYKSNWHQGVLGIVASRLCERYQRPVILFADHVDEVGPRSGLMVKGSGRSVAGIDIHEAVSSCQELLLRFGGHAGAVGLSLQAEDIETFRSGFDNFLEMQDVKNKLIPSLTVDLEIDPRVLTDQTFLANYNSLTPFGNGNPEPVFCLKSQKLQHLRVVGSHHLRFSIMEDSLVMNGIGFGLSGHFETSQNNRVDLVFTLRLNTYMAQNNWEMNLLALRPSS